MASPLDVLALILAGGRVDELDVLTYHRPKSAVPFGGVARVIDFALSNLMHSGIERVGVLSQFRSFSLINHIGSGIAWDMAGRHRGIDVLPPFLDHGHSHWYRGTADAVYQNRDFIQFLDPAHTLVLSGDHVYRMDYRQLIGFHKKNNADITIAFARVSGESAHRFGIGEIGGDEDGPGGPLLSYEEKPETPRGCWASLTILCCNTDLLLATLAGNQQRDDSYEFGRDIIPRLLRDGKKVYGYRFRGYWGYTRTVHEYWRTSMDLLGDAPKIPLEEWRIRTNMEHRGIRDHKPLLIGPAGSLVNSLAYNGCEVHGHVENSILFPGVHIAAGASVRDSILFFKNRVEGGVEIVKTISDVNNVFGPEARIGALGCETTERPVVVGWNNSVPAGTVIGAGASVVPACQAAHWPRKIDPEAFLE